LLEDKKTEKIWDDMMLSEDDRKDFHFVKDRIDDLKNARKEIQYGVKVESIWQEADKEYSPHRLDFTGRNSGKQLVQYDDELKGWASTYTKVGTSSWQSDIAQPNPFKKIQIALSILVDQNPSAVFTPGSKKYEATNELVKQLYHRNWEKTKSIQQLKLFIFNLAKYGWAVGRTYPLKVVRKVKNILEWNQESPDKTTYEEKEVVQFNDIYRENLDPWNVWIDDMAKPNNELSMRDWTWRVVYSMDKAEEEFGNWSNWKYVREGGTVTDKLSETDKNTKKFKEKHLVEVYFYENVVKDLFMVIVNDVPVVISPLPISDSAGHKKLSLWQTYWNLRHANSPYGIGIYEAMRNNNNLYDIISNMSVDQLVLSIYKMFFYQGTTMLNETGDIKIQPGVGKQTLDPKNITFLEVPGPGQEAVNWRELVKKDLDDDSGITDALLGSIPQKGKQTAFQIAQAKESALKRLKAPLDNVTDALDQEAYITVSLMQLIYSVPEVYDISDPDLIDAYLKEVGGDKQLYSRDNQGTFQAKVYPEFQLNLDKDEQGNLIETKDSRFFRVKPDALKWEGVINVKSQSVLTPSKQIDKAMDLEMYNMLVPLLAQPSEIYQKVAKNIVKLYDKDPKDILPDLWINPPNPQNQPMFIPANQAQNPQQSQQGQDLQATAKPQSMIGKIGSALAKPFKSFGANK
jgi:hypothetical protein